MFVGAGSAAATGVIAAGTKVPFSMAQLGMISFAFMLVIVGAVYAIGHISGGHINPAVTLSLAVSGKFPWREVPGYMIAQLAGAIAGAASIYLTLGRLATVAAGGGVTAYNPATMGFGRGLAIEAIGTFMLVFVIFGVIDHRAVPGWAPMAIGAVVFAIIIILGPATGAAINPARYLGAVFMLKAFGGKVLWSQLPAYLIGEFVGGALGGLAWVAIGRVRAGRGDDQPRARRPRPQHRQLGESQWSHVMKKLINSPETVVTDALEGVAAAHPSLSVDVENKVITRAGGPRPGKVGLVSGGGSGHEPLHGGFVGYGMLDAACPGEVFTSPVPDQMLSRDQGRQRRRGRAAHSEELHRRRAELPDGGGDGRGRRHRGRPGRDQR